MRIIARSRLVAFWKRHPDAEQPLRAWFAETRQAAWKSMMEVKARYPTASVLDAERVVFNVGGNKFRLAAKVWFAGQAVWIKFVGTHKEYDRIDVRSL